MESITISFSSFIIIWLWVYLFSDLSVIRSFIWPIVLIKMVVKEVYKVIKE